MLALLPRDSPVTDGNTWRVTGDYPSCTHMTEKQKRGEGKNALFQLGLLELWGQKSHRSSWQTTAYPLPLSLSSPQSGFGTANNGFL